MEQLPSLGHLGHARGGRPGLAHRDEPGPLACDAACGGAGRGLSVRASARARSRSEASEAKEEKVSATVFERVAKRIDGYRDWIVEVQTKLTATKALDPASGGDGEGEKAKLVLAILSELGVKEIQVLESDDERVSTGKRPNIVARVPGMDRSRTLWIMSHMDVVPAGDLKDWKSDPWTVRVEGDRIYGRGVEDNQQGMMGSLCLVRAMHEERAEPPFDLALLFVADEETGNKRGIEFLLGKHEIFRPGDSIVVPDGGSVDGSMIEVAEKGIVWLRCNVRGKAAHGSLPDRGINAHMAAAHMVVRLEKLGERFSRRDEVFDPPTCTFPVTKVEAGVPNVNTIPGEHTFYLDCRVVPGYSLDEVIGAVQEITAAVDRERGTTTTVDHVQRTDAAPPTATDAPVVKALGRAVKAVYGVEGKPMGIGGGTVAACIRRKGYAAAVWGRMDETMHGPNEYCILSNLMGDAKVFAHMLFV
ncbi:MAG: M20 family metallo-hydrolase [Deltaproteobacteria bacterium]|nr:M20 family metallo-hydrolase [Deltaproteobacteria bacterium]